MNTQVYETTISAPLRMPGQNVFRQRRRKLTTALTKLAIDGYTLIGPTLSELVEGRIVTTLKLTGPDSNPLGLPEALWGRSFWRDYNPEDDNG